MYGKKVESCDLMGSREYNRVSFAMPRDVIIAGRNARMRNFISSTVSLSCPLLLKFECAACTACLHARAMERHLPLCMCVGPRLRAVVSVAGGCFYLHPIASTRIPN